MYQWSALRSKAGCLDAFSLLLLPVPPPHTTRAVPHTHTHGPTAAAPGPAPIPHPHTTRAVPSASANPPQPLQPLTLLEEGDSICHATRAVRIRQPATAAPAATLLDAGDRACNSSCA